MGDDTTRNFKKFLILKFYNEISSFYNFIKNNKHSTDRWDFTIKRKNFYFQKSQLQSISSLRYPKNPEYGNQNYGFFYIKNSYSKSHMHREFIQIGQFCHNDLHKNKKMNYLADEFTEIVIHFFD